MERSMFAVAVDGGKGVSGSERVTGGGESGAAGGRRL